MSFKTPRRINLHFIPILYNDFAHKKLARAARDWLLFWLDWPFSASKILKSLEPKSQASSSPGNADVWWEDWWPSLYTRPQISIYKSDHRYLCTSHWKYSETLTGRMCKEQNQNWRPKYPNIQHRTKSDNFLQFFVVAQTVETLHVCS
jgi:hypothetical protein